MLHKDLSLTIFSLAHLHFVTLHIFCVVIILLPLVLYLAGLGSILVVVPIGVFTNNIINNTGLLLSVVICILCLYLYISHQNSKITKLLPPILTCRVDKMVGGYFWSLCPMSFTVRHLHQCIDNKVIV